jgi:hypothetical protein
MLPATFVAERLAAERPIFPAPHTAARLEGTTVPLHVACQTGDIERVADVLLADRSVDPNARNEAGVSPIVAAAGKGRTPVVALLLRDGRVDANLRGRRGRGALHGACLRGHRAVVSALLADPRVDADVVDDEGRSPLADAVRKGRADILQLFLQVPGRCTPATLAAARGHARGPAVAKLVPLLDAALQLQRGGAGRGLRPGPDEALLDNSSTTIAAMAPSPARERGRLALSSEPAEATQSSKKNRKFRPNNWGYSAYVDKVYGMGCFAELVRLRVFLDAKDISESYGALQVGVRQGLLGDHSLRQVEQKDYDAVAAERQGGVLCISIGDGSTPRTACLAAFLTGWTTVAVDPALRRDWSGPAPKGVHGLHGVCEKFEDFMQQRALVESLRSTAAAADGDGCGSGSGGPGDGKRASRGEAVGAWVPGGGSVGSTGTMGGLRHLLLLCVHAHHRFRGPASLPSVRAAFGNPPTTVVAVPCCPTFNPTKDIGRPADVVFEDPAMFSACRRVLVWRWAQGMDPRGPRSAASLQQLRQGDRDRASHRDWEAPGGGGAGGEAVVPPIETAEIERLLGVREAARAAKEFRRADAVHRQLADHGVTMSYKTLTWQAPGGREGPIAPWKTHKTPGS